MLKAGITGGIGSGKTLVCRMFELLGVPVFYADTEARLLMEQDPVLIQGITDIFGPEAYTGSGKLNRKWIAARAFNDPALLERLNNLTHPAVIRHGREWMAARQFPYALKEAALFFESGSNRDMDIMIGVSAPLELRISRTMARDGISRDEVLARMARQMDENEKMALCDYVIHNDGKSSLIRQVLSLHNVLYEKAGAARF